MTHRRPTSKEYGAFYARYISQVKDDNIVRALKKGKSVVVNFLQKIPKSKWEHRYGSDKWTIKEVVVHLMDAERVLAYRALRIARGDKKNLSGYDQDAWVPNSIANDRTPASIIAEYRAVREATIQLFKNLDDEALDRSGKASSARVTPRAAGFIIAGHEIHHMTIIRDRYL